MTKICLTPNTLGYPEGGGHRWVYLNWALGLRAVGCEVIWLEVVKPHMPADRLRANLSALAGHLRTYGLLESLALCGPDGHLAASDLTDEFLNFDVATEADLLLNFRYSLSPALVPRFRRTALVDIDPGMLQIWMKAGDIDVARHDVYFTIGETVGKDSITDVGIKWHYTPPCVALDRWTPHAASAEAPFTTVSHWYSEDWVTDVDDTFFRNDKRAGFLPFLDLPRRTTQLLELALYLGGDLTEKAVLQTHGWRVREAREVVSTPSEYQRYIQESRGEFSCAKPSCVRLQNAWISDRTLCYLASGKPAVVQHTGPSRFLPDSAGLFRFHQIDDAVRSIERVAMDYGRQSRLARGLAEEYFDARKVVGKVLERALD